MASKLGNTIIRSYAAGSAGPSAVAGEGAGGSKMWRNLTIIIAVPAMLVCGANSYLKNNEPGAMDPPPFKAYTYLRLRTKPFPWGDGNHTLFHNPHVNPLPDGFETKH